MITLINPTLPYGFAKRHGVILLEAGEVCVVGLREGADPSALIETRRALGRPLRVGSPRKLGAIMVRRSMLQFCAVETSTR